jgi:hypothetical protein
MVRDLTEAAVDGSAEKRAEVQEKARRNVEEPFLPCPRPAAAFEEPSAAEGPRPAGEPFHTREAARSAALRAADACSVEVEVRSGPSPPSRS